MTVLNIYVNFVCKLGQCGFAKLIVSFALMKQRARLGGHPAMNKLGPVVKSNSGLNTKHI